MFPGSDHLEVLAMTAPAWPDLRDMSEMELLNHAKSLRETCAAQDAAAQKAQVEMGRAGLTEKRLRDKIKREIIQLERTYDELTHEGTLPCDPADPVKKAAVHSIEGWNVTLHDWLDVPRTQAEKRAEALVRYWKANQAYNKKCSYLADHPFHHDDTEGMKKAEDDILALTKELDLAEIACREAGVK